MHCPIGRRGVVERGSANRFADRGPETAVSRRPELQLGQWRFVDCRHLVPELKLGPNVDDTAGSPERNRDRLRAGPCACCIGGTISRAHAVTQSSSTPRRRRRARHSRCSAFARQSQYLLVPEAGDHEPRKRPRNTASNVCSARAVSARCFSPHGRAGRDRVPEVVCIKVSSRIDGWLREAYFGDLLDGHPRAIRVFDAFPLFGHGQVLYCLAMEYAAHGDLSAHLERSSRRVSPSRRRGARSPASCRSSTSCTAARCCIAT